METGLEKMIEEEMEKWEKQQLTVEQIFECMPHELCDYANIVPEEKNYFWSRDCKNKELKEDSDAFECHLKNH